jgi:5-methylcytosine-specific restriction protein B
MDEVERRRGKLAQIRTQLANDEEAVRAWAQISADRIERHPEAVALLERLRNDGDLDSFRRALDAWAQRPGYESVRGFTLMFLNQLALRAADDPSPVAALLARCLRVPSDESDADAKITALAEHVNNVKRSGHPAPGRVPHVLSLFWSMQDHERWPCLWPSGEEMLKTLGWLTPSWDQPERYRRFREVVLGLGIQPVEAERAMYEFKKVRWTGLDPALLDRCAENARFLQVFDEESDYPTEERRVAAEHNALAIRGELSLLAQAILEPMSIRLKSPVTAPDVHVRTSFARAAPYRADGYANWSLPWGTSAPTVRAWATADGVAVGAHPGWPREGWQGEAAARVAAHVGDELQFFKVEPHGSGHRLEPAGREYPGGECFVGRWFPGPAALDRVDFADDVLDTASALRPLLDEWVTPDSVTIANTPEAAQDDLAALVEQFRTKRPYPNDKDTWHEAERVVLAQRFTPEALEAFDVDALRLVANSNRYGKPGPMSHLNLTLRMATSKQLDEIAHVLTELLWGSGSDEERINRVLESGFAGLGESVTMKLLSITHPERYIPAFPYTGEMGKASLMHRIGLDPPPAKGRTRGELQVLSNDLIRARLDPYLPSPWAQAQFLYWLKARGERPVEDEVDVLGELAKELLVERAFLEELVELLRERGQIILYGPPGTGKTYVAKKLAAALVPDPTRRMVVQFHPSTSYEDFFEGYRPVASAEGQMAYELRPGPLSILADRAENAPGIDHLLVIDEINRANLPKVLGELLFLLEYRGETIRTLYRPDEAFELPKNLLVVGTMNTADRSVSLVDAALRRRFHFVPFFPNDGAMEGLLDRWLEANDEPPWIAGLVAMVNEELRVRLGGPHLQIGPSHFMVEGVEERLPRIWAYDIYPFVENELYGDRSAIDDYRYERVVERYRSGTLPAGD